MAHEFHLLIDDLRTLDVDVISRNGEVGKRLMEEGEVTHLWLDNDLGNDVPQEGIDILKWARDNDCVPPNVFIVSANPIARKRMEDVLHFDLNYRYDRQTQWWRKPSGS